MTAPDTLPTTPSDGPARARILDARPWSALEAVSPYLRITDLRRPEDLGRYWRTMLLGLLPGALAVAGLTWGAISGPASVSALFALAAGLLGLWWLAAATSATRRRLLDADADPHLALAWPSLPFAAASGFLGAGLVVSLARVPFPDQTPIALVAAIVAAAVLLVLVLAAAAVPSQRWPWRGRPVMLIAGIVLMPVVTGLVVLVWKIIRGVVRPNLGTRLLLLACAIGLLAVAGQNALDPVTRTVLAVLIGLVYAGVHVLRWRLQVRHFRSATIDVHYASRENLAVRDPRYRPLVFRVFKVLALGGIVISTLAAMHPATPPTVAIIVAAFLASTGFLAIFGVIGVIVAMLPWIPALDGSLASIAIPYLIVYIVVACYFGFRLLMSRPTDNRYNFTSAFRQYERASEW